MATKLKAARGATFRKSWAWYAGPDAVKPITAVTRGFPTILTCASHNLPSADIPVSLISMGELTTLNSDGAPSFKPADRILASKTGADTFSIDFDSSESDAFATGLGGIIGYLVYTPPKDLTGYTARLQFREAVDSADVLLALDETDGLDVGTTEGTIDMVLTDTQTTDFPLDSAVWNLELVASGPGDVTRFDEGTLELSPDVNRPVV